MIIQALPSGPFETNAYIIACPQTQEAAIIDPGVDSAKAIKTFIHENALIPKKIVLTHSHWDHTGNVAELKEFFNIPVYIHNLDAPNLINPGSDGLPMITPIKATKPDGFLVEGDSILVGKLRFSVIETPGHTPGGICLYCENEQVLISGDTLFKQSIGNLSFPGCSADAMWKSLKKLEKLPKETHVYPGHGPKTTIGNEGWLPNAQEIFGV